VAPVNRLVVGSTPTSESLPPSKDHKAFILLNHIYPIKTKVTRQQREQLLQQRPLLIWFTGLSGSGKSTLAVQLEAQLHEAGFKTYLLDGDNIRAGLNKDLSFTDEGRVENIRRIGEVSKLMLDAGIIVLSAFISPFHADREQVKNIVGSENYLEVFVDTPLDVCEQRDVKGLYKKARAGEVKNFTGIDSPYEAPQQPDIAIPTHRYSVEESVDHLMNSILPRVTAVL
jgi:adenylyl-sulfate kinase